MAEGGAGFSNLYTAVTKFRSTPTGTSAVAVWTPTTSTRVVLTDLHVIAVTGTGGTIQFRFGNVGGIVVAEFVSGGTLDVQWSPTTPKYNPVYDQALFMETAFTGYVSVTAGGFEQE